MSRLENTSWSLIERAAAGEPADREEFARRYAPVVGAYFCARWRLPLEHERVQDATQELFLQCFKTGGVLERFDPDGPANFRGFLFGVARKVAARVEARLHRRREVSVQSGDLLDIVERSEATLSQAFDRAWAKMIACEAGKLMQARAESLPRRREAYHVLQLRFHEGLAPRDIAPLMDREIKVVYELLREGKRQYRAAFLEVMASQNPHFDEAQLKDSCIDLADQL